MPEAEDIVQDTFEHLLTVPAGHVKNLKTYLTRVVANKSIDRLKILKKERGRYPGVWLPPPYVQAEDTPEVVTKFLLGIARKERTQ